MADTTTPHGRLILTVFGGLAEFERHLIVALIDVFICKLRKKLANASGDKNYIGTVWGHGYVLREPSDYKAKISA